MGENGRNGKREEEKERKEERVKRLRGEKEVEQEIQGNGKETGDTEKRRTGGDVEFIRERVRDGY